MNEELYEFYSNCLIEARAPERAAPLVELVTLLLDFEYGDELADIHNLVKDNLQEDIIPVERVIVRCAVALASTMGVALDPDKVYAVPSATLRLLHALTGDFEEFEDFDTLLAIACSGETEEYILENMIRHIHVDAGIFLDGLIINVEPRVMIVITNYLEAKMLENEESDIDYDAQARLVRYIRVYPTNPMVSTFVNAAYKLNPSVVADNLVWEDPMGNIELAIIYLVGLVTMDSDNYNLAYARMEKRVHWLHVEDDAEITEVLSKAVIGLKQVYEVV